MEFWNTILTQKSWDTLKDLTKKPFHFILIGGWAAYLWTKLHKSKDIDIIIADYKSLGYIKTHFNLVKNNQLKKYEIKIEEVDIDIYAPFFSKLAIPVDEIKSYATKIENINVVKPEVLLILKQAAEIERSESIKGQKDRIDIMALLCFAPLDFKIYFKLLEKYKLAGYYENLKRIVLGFTQIKHLNINQNEFKKKKEEILAKLKKN